MLDADADPLADEIGHHLPVAVLGMPLEAQHADPPPGLHQRGQLIELLLRRGGGEMGVVNAPQLTVVPAARWPSAGVPRPRRCR